ncbi:MAG TPA: endonuclease/exonuclease/phosphatase family protein [Anaeromyxobacteraceae bacterium]|nr:endonuclease/exonuclease/phosphatase family protein [Anaeromyxobacteraceae bacterium]
MLARATARSLLAAALAAALAACGYADRPSPRVYVPFEAISGPLQPELRNAAAAPPPDGALRVVTFNVHLGEEIAAVEAAFLGNPTLQAAGVVLLEEIDAHPADGVSQAARLAGALGMSHAYAPAFAYPDGGTHGIAVLSRWPITSGAVLDLPFFDLVENSERRIAVHVTLAVGDRTLAVTALHLDTRIDPNDRLEQLLPAVDLADPTCILGGDFNSNPYLWAGRVLPLLPVQAAAPVDVAGAIDEFMRSRGFSAPTSGSGDTTNLSIGNTKLDSIYLRGYQPLGSGVARDVDASDHFPVWVDVAWPPSP